MNEWIKNMVFGFPYALALFAVLPVLIVWYVKKNNQHLASIKVSSAYAFAISSWKNRFRHMPFIFRVLALSCLIIALARPQKKNEEKRTEGKGIDIFLCMDVSGSMGSRDILPSRLEAAKEVAIEFVHDRPADRIGLVIFSGESFLQCPLTTDKNTLIAQIQSLESRKYLADGTVIGEGLATAVKHLSQSGSKSKVVILLTDGKEEPPVTRVIDPPTALEIAKTQKVKVYTIGINAASSASSTATEITESSSGEKISSNDQPDEDLLRQIAEETGGQYFRVRDRESLTDIYKQIDALEKSDITVTTHNRYEEKFLLFMLAALGLLFLEIVIRFTVFRKFP